MRARAGLVCVGGVAAFSSLYHKTSCFVLAPPPAPAAWTPLHSQPGQEGSVLTSTVYPNVIRTGNNSYCLDQSNSDVQFIASHMPWYGPSHSPDTKDVVAEPKNTRFTSFYDVAGITENPVAFRKVVELLVRRYKANTEAGYGPTKIAGFEPRGFIFGAAVAVQLGIPFVMIGKSGRLPGILASSGKGETRAIDSEAVMRLGSVKPGDRVVVFDDLVATGGTAIAGMELVDSLGAEVHEFCAMMAPAALGGVNRIHSHDNAKFAGVTIFTLLQDETVQTLVGRKMDYTPPAGTPRQVTAKEARDMKLIGGDNVPLWP